MKNSTKIWIGVALGAAVGAAVYLLSNRGEGIDIKDILPKDE